ncbi:DNA primase large subunit-like [Hetaerina americana]|uniref:DNA primase large subunit-like n=1 Tax=Hetaerina americana TaxID=62018 RepID=UPI003A7F5C0A
MYDYSDVRKMMLTLQRHLHETVNPADLSYSSSSLFSAITRICLELLKGTLLKHALDKHHSGACRKYVVIVDFQHCSSLVKRREVELISGRCHVHCGAWRKLLICFFHDLLLHGVEKMEGSPISKVINSDIRLNRIVSLTLDFFNKNFKFSHGSMQGINTITSNMVDRESDFFPPCALNVLQTLRHDHRVRHHARIELSLFLKGIGMDVNEAIKFWKEEYSKTPHCSEQGSKCCQHVWRNDYSRYIYNIQHLYGLKGSCKNYYTKSCSTLQSAGSKTEEGCPFVRMNTKDLLKVLPRAVSDRCGHSESSHKNLIDPIIELASKGKPREACNACFAAHCAGLQNQDLDSDKELVSEDKYSKKKVDCACAGKLCVEKSDASSMKMCCQDKAKHVNSDMRVAISSDQRTECFREEVKNKGEIVDDFHVHDGLSSDEKFSSECFSDGTIFHYPTQYYFALKSRIMSQDNFIKQNAIQRDRTKVCEI